VTLEDRIEEMLRYAVASERIRAVMALIVYTAEELGELVEQDSELIPEVEVAAAHLAQASAAIRRAHGFAGERMSVKLRLPESD